ncbi:ABC transporter ATP-binding protein [Desulfosarcina sp. OttesenSCG-928-A07]|nr:ABC transporter ATP-binding protein [Desulfosarcina sp. OttesenSCG-928-G17]MDL2330227.1 ABC transporter ATP-binding protein [Desulfosarcina sp. OttesenSCG-928-A07]
MTHTPALSACKLTCRYPKMTAPVLDGLDLSLEKGEIFGLLGPNGAGKTTTLSILSTIRKPDAGTLTILGMNPRRNLRDIRRIIGLVPQDIALYPELTARENLRFFGKLQGLCGHLLSLRIETALAAVGLESRADEPVKTFSGGMKRRANLAAGILHEPEILFLDEPTVGIDAQSRQLIMDRIRALQARGTTVLYTTHYMEEARQICSRVAIMDQGRIRVQGTVDELLLDHPGCKDLGDLFLRLTGKTLRDG